MRRLTGAAVPRIALAIPWERGYAVVRATTDGTMVRVPGTRLYPTRRAAELAADRLNTPAEERARVRREAKARGLTLAGIPGTLHAAAIETYDRGEVFLNLADNMDALALLAPNAEPLKRAGLYERSLLYALTMPRTNTAQAGMGLLRSLVACADRDALRAAGDPLPGPGPFTVYRGVAGRGAARRVAGISWTFSQAVAAWFAARFPGLADPAVYRVTVDFGDVLAYDNGRTEEELLVLLPPGATPERVLDGADLAARWLRSGRPAFARQPRPAFNRSERGARRRGAPRGLAPAGAWPQPSPPRRRRR